MSAKYSLEAILSEAEALGLSLDERNDVAALYIDTAARYEREVPYSAVKLPGTEGVALYGLNKSMIAHAASVRETRRIIDALHRNSSYQNEGRK